MLLTEDQAKTKWCPFTRCAETRDDELEGPFNRYHSASEQAHITEQALCIGHKCMAWRWTPFALDMINAADDPNTVRKDARGYCGLAGSPVRGAW
ncbi:hypothetical protein ACI3L3_10295 [Desulfobaculum sp. SPO524]|uniref:hypothetical protein n=1 Tax=Desulfobaculum sp. SPO524 TaxID=3378071 RepID=UPI0038541599